MHKKRSVYIGYSEEDVRKLEGTCYVLIFGGDFIAEDECFLFTKKQVQRVYRKMMKDLAGIVADGNEKDRKYALDLIGGMVIKPMRLH